MKVLRRLFRPSRVEIWRQLADGAKARFVEGEARERDRLEVTHDGWTMTLDSFFSAAAKADFTRLRAFFPNPGGFRFTLARRGLFSDLAVRLGMQDVEIGEERFDRDFVIRGTDEAGLRALLDSPDLREKVAAQPEIRLAVQKPGKPVPPGLSADTDELCFIAPGVIRDLDRLRQMFDLLAETLDRLSLVRIGEGGEGSGD